MMRFVAVSPIQTLPFSPPDAKKRDPSAENAMPMKVAFTSTRVTAGVLPWMLRINEMENCDAPLLIVASVIPSGESASPYGLGASSMTSVPTGVTSRPLGRMAAR